MKKECHSMENIAIINVVPDKSTGKIGFGLYKYLSDKKYNVKFCYGRGTIDNDRNCYKIDKNYEIYLHAAVTRMVGLQGSMKATKRLVSYLRKNQVKTVYILNVNGYYLNENILFRYLSRDNIHVVYIMIDEYAFLGRCCYQEGCMRYMRGCGKCPRARSLYPQSFFFDTSRIRFKAKSKNYKSMKKIMFVGPKYVVQKAKKSPLMHNMKTAVLDEAIDVDFYRPRNTNAIKEIYGIQKDDFVAVCITPYPNKRKGGEYFIQLAREFKEEAKYKFVHVGVSGKVDDRPANYIPIGYIKDQEQLAQFYSLGDVFVFPSLEDTMPNACLEALSCGTPLVCFDISGMPYLGDERVLTLAAPKDVRELKKIISHMEKKTEDISRTCREYARTRYDNKNYYRKLELLGLQCG